jgi:DNA-binding response OmpR family regulator
MAKILIIEDDQFYLKIYKKKFEVEGFQVETAENGAEGLQKAVSFQPDLILLDIMMAGMDGFEVLEKLKLEPKSQRILIAMMTNLSTQTDMEKAVQMGAQSYIIKSDFTPSQVVAHIKELLQNPGAVKNQVASPKTEAAPQTAEAVTPAETPPVPKEKAA